MQSLESGFTGLSAETMHKRRKINRQTRAEIDYLRTQIEKKMTKSSNFSPLLRKMETAKKIILRGLDFSGLVKRWPTTKT